jgi:cysteine-S-conjugate beta-lyase
MGYRSVYRNGIGDRSRGDRPHSQDVKVNPLTELSLEQLRERRSVKWRMYPDDVLPMFVAEMDTLLAPAIVTALSDAVVRGDTGYADPGRLAEAYATFAVHRFGWAPDPEPMRVVADVNSGIYEIVKLLTRRGDTVVLDTPAYPPFFAKLTAAERAIVENPMLVGEDGRWRPDLDGLARAFEAGAAVYLLCNPHNPTGTVLDQYGVRVLADEIHGPLTYPGVTHIPFLTLDAPAARSALAFVSASKAWNLPGLKAALIVPGRDAEGPLEGLPIEASFGAGLFGVLAGEAALVDGRVWLDELMAGLDHNRARLAARLAEALPEIGYRPPDATYLAWLDCRALGLGDDPAEVFLERGRLALNSGPAFGDPGKGFARLNLAAHPELIDEAVRRMAAAVRAA